MNNRFASKHGKFGSSRGRRGFAVLLLVLVCASLALAQLDTGTIAGTGTDQSGGAIPGAAITIRNVATGISRRVETNAAGRYEAAALPVGNYEVSVSLTGFQTVVRSGIALTVGRNAVVDIVLQVGEVTQTITITGEASQVETTTATVTQLVNERRVLEIPLNNRDLTQLAFFQPGVLRTLESNDRRRSASSAFGAQLTVGGARPGQNLYLLDGVSNTDLNGNAQGASQAYTGAETVQEFQVITNNYSAEYASKPGAIISAVTKSGTNSLHGSLFEFHRNDNLDAARWEENAFCERAVFTEGCKPEFKRNQFGGSLGGPILRDRTFFFMSYEGLRERKGKLGLSRVPRAEVHAGTWYNNVTIAPKMRPYLALYPIPGQPVPLSETPTGLVKLFDDGTADVGIPEREPANENFGAIKLDHQFGTEKAGFLSLTYNISDADWTLFGGLINEDAIGNASKKHVISARHTSILSPTTLNEFVFGLTKTQPSGDFPAYAVDWSNVNGRDLRFHPTRDTMGLIRPGDVDNLGYPAAGSIFQQNDLQFRDTLSLTRAAHTIKFGVDISHLQLPIQTTSSSFAGTYVFDGLENFLLGNPEQLEHDLEKGVIVQGQPVLGIIDFDVRQYLFGFFFQDNYKVRPSLTLNLGLRYEFMTNPTEQNGNLYTLRNFNDPTTTQGDMFRNPTKRSCSPRLGFAWSPGGDQRTVLRGGVGIYYEPLTLQYWRTSFGEMVPVNVAGVIEDPDSTGFIDFPNGPTTQVNELAKIPNLRSPEYNMQPTYTYRWSLTLEREIGPWLVSAGYTGSRGRGNIESSTANLNRWQGWPNNPTGAKYFPPPRLPNGNPNPEYRGLINPNFANMWITAPRSNTFYHALTLNVLRRLSRGLQFQGAYTFSRNVADFGGGQGNQIYYWDVHLRRGLTDIHVKHNFVSNATYEIPGTGLTGVGGALLNGWQINGILTLSAGYPFQPRSRENASSDAIGQARELRPNLIPGGNNNPVLGTPSDGKTHYFDVNQFIPAACHTGVYCYDIVQRSGRTSARPNYALGYDPGYFGNLGANTIIGPGFVTFDSSIVKNFPLTEGKRLQFRAEFFNLLNRPNFRPPTTDLFRRSGSTEGLRDVRAAQITQTRISAREIQFGLKFIF